MSRNRTRQYLYETFRFVFLCFLNQQFSSVFKLRKTTYPPRAVAPRHLVVVVDVVSEIPTQQLNTLSRTFYSAAIEKML